MRRSAKSDSNQAEIVDCLRKAGRCVFVASRIGGGFPDLIVHWNGNVVFMEVKSENGELNDLQIDFHSKWRGPAIVIVRTIRDALAATGINVR